MGADGGGAGGDKGWYGVSLKGPGASLVREMWRTAEDLRRGGGQVVAIWLEGSDFDLVAAAYQAVPFENEGRKWLMFGEWKGRSAVFVNRGQPEEWA